MEPFSHQQFSLIGNRLCIDFANAADGSQTAISSWIDLVVFFVAVGILDATTGDGLRNSGGIAEAEASAALATAKELCAAIRSIIEAIATGRPVQAQWIDPVNSVLLCTEGYDQLVPAKAQGKAWRLGFVARQQRLEWLLAPIARSAAELLAEGRGAPVRKCASPRCPLYFYDTSRNGKRRWCSMSTCGNRSKVAAHARRTRAAGT